MKENDYYGHYKAFVKELRRKPDQTLQVYCQENGVVWRRLYCRGLSQDLPEKEVACVLS